jgi:hypothetical protein
MKLSIYALSVVAVLAVGGSALAANATTNGSANDDTGMASLGVDITGAGNTPDSVNSFVAGLSTVQQSGLRNGCQGIAADPTNANPKVVSFCTNLNGQ